VQHSKKERSVVGTSSQNKSGQVIAKLKIDHGAVDGLVLDVAHGDCEVMDERLRSVQT
jgi:hypothetical protein